METHCGPKQFVVYTDRYVWCVYPICTYVCTYAGVSLYLEGTGLISNNSIVEVLSSGSNRQLQCISASRSANVGRLILPNGGDITSHSSVTVGDSTDPGFVSLGLQNSATLTSSNQGVYRCIIPDENGVQQYLHFGLYHGRFNSMFEGRVKHCLGAKTIFTLKLNK